MWTVLAVLAEGVNWRRPYVAAQRGSTETGLSPEDDLPIWLPIPHGSADIHTLRHLLLISTVWCSSNRQLARLGQ